MAVKLYDVLRTLGARSLKVDGFRKAIIGAAIATVEEPVEREDYRDRYERLTGKSLRDCPICGKGHMLCIETFPVGSLPRVFPPDTS
jgi:hypothetical protein